MKTIKLERPLVIFDLETTGVDTDEDRIVEMATLKIFPDGTTEEKSRRFNPGVPIPKEASDIHGITDEDVRDEPPFRRLAKGVAAYLDGCDLAGFNIVSFDVPMLQAEMDRAGVNVDFSLVPQIDICKIFHQKEPRDLAAGLKFYCGREHVDAHGALADVKATRDILFAQLARYEDLPDTPEGLDRAMMPEDYIDREGKLRRGQDGDVMIGFGKHRGKTLQAVVREGNYVDWMLKNNVVKGSVARGILEDAKRGIFAK